MKVKGGKEGNENEIQEMQIWWIGSLLLYAVDEEGGGINKKRRQGREIHLSKIKKKKK